MNISTRKGEHKFANNGIAMQAIECRLTQRQEEIYVLLLRGLPNKRIAQLLGIAESTVKEHVKGTLEKLGFKNRIEALVNARDLAALSQ